MQNLESIQLIEIIRQKADLDRGFIAKTAKETGINQDKFYKWLKGRGKPGLEDGLTLQNYLGLLPKEVPSKDNYQEKYIALLERDRDLLENKIDRIEVNLDLVRNGQMGVLLAIQVGLDEQAEMKAAVLKTDPAVVKEGVNKKLKKGLKVGIHAD